MYRVNVGERWVNVDRKRSPGKTPYRSRELSLVGERCERFSQPYTRARAQKLHRLPNVLKAHNVHTMGGRRLALPCPDAPRNRGFRP